MQLTFDQIRAVTVGAVDFEETKDYLQPYRFTKAQREFTAYADRYYHRGMAAAGICFGFETDSESLSLEMECLSTQVRDYFSFEVFVDGKLVGYLDNFPEEGLPSQHYHLTQLEKPEGIFNKTFVLGAGQKLVRVNFPWSKLVRIRSVSLDNGATLVPVKKDKKLLAFGDSITHGMDAYRPSQRYIAQLADFLGADEYNKAIAGETYCPGLAACRDDFTPDYITVAYGANDWSLKSKEDLERNSRLFYANLQKNYPGVPVFVITPIWRADREESRPFGSFDDVEATIRKNAADFPQIQVIRGYDLVPHDTKYFVEAKLHPTTEGFAHYGKNLCAQIGALLNK